MANRASILERAEQLVAAARRRLDAGLRPSDEHRALYEDAALLLLFVAVWVGKSRTPDQHLERATANLEPVFGPEVLSGMSHASAKE